MREYVEIPGYKRGKLMREESDRICLKEREFERGKFTPSLHRHGNLVRGSHGITDTAPELHWLGRQQKTETPTKNQRQTEETGQRKEGTEARKSQASRYPHHIGTAYGQSPTSSPPSPQFMFFSLFSFFSPKT
jgi:hypothetical protein